MTKPRPQDIGADVFIDHIMPAVRDANREGSVDDMLAIYSGCLGALWGSMAADFGQVQASEFLEIALRKFKAMPPLERTQ